VKKFTELIREIADFGDNFFVNYSIARGMDMLSLHAASTASGDNSSCLKLQRGLVCHGDASMAILSILNQGLEK
jgi:hypothetical protein